MINSPRIVSTFIVGLWSLILLMLLCAGELQADQASPQPESGSKYSLADSINIAIRKNRTIRNAYLDRIVQKYDLLVAEDKFTPKMLLTPSIKARGANGDVPTTKTTSLSGTITEILPTGATINVAANHDLTSSTANPQARAFGWNVTIAQPLLKGGGLEAATASVRTARLNEQSNILSFKSTLIDTVNSVILAYRAYVQAIKALEISKQSLERSKELLVTNKQLIAAGRMAEIEIVQTEADVASREFNLLSSENAVDAARLALLKALDIDKNTRLLPMDEVTIPPIPFTLEEAKKLAFSNRPDYQQFLIGMENAKITLATAKNNTLWDLSLAAGYGEANLDGGGLSDSSDRSWNSGLVLTVPIGDLTIKQGYLNAKIALQKLENDLGKLQESIAIEVQDALRNAEMNQRQIKLASMSRTLSEKKVKIETEKLKVGRSTNFQLVSFQNDLVNAQSSELNAIISYLNALSSLERTLGITLDSWGITLAEREERQSRP